MVSPSDTNSGSPTTKRKNKRQEERNGRSHMKGSLLMMQIVARTKAIKFPANRTATIY